MPLHSLTLSPVNRTISALIYIYMESCFVTIGPVYIHIIVHKFDSFITYIFEDI